MSRLTTPTTPAPTSTRTSPATLHTSAGAALAAARSGLVLLLVATLTVLTLPFAATPASASGWPHTVFSYDRFDGRLFSDPIDLGPGNATADISSGVVRQAGGGAQPTGPLPSVYLGVNDTDVTFRLRLADNPRSTTAGGLVGDFFVAQVAIETAPGVWTHVASAGVNGKSSSADTTYVARVSPYTEKVLTTWNGTEIPAVRIASAGNPDAPLETFLDWRVPIAELTAMDARITRTTPLKFFLGTSAAANLVTINKDFMSGSAMSFAESSVITLTDAAIDLRASAAHVDGPNPPQAKRATTWDVTWRLPNPNANPLQATVTAALGDHVSLVGTPAAPTGTTFSASGGQLTWSVPRVPGGGSREVTFRVRLDAAVSQVDQNVEVVAAPVATGLDLATGATSTDTEPALRSGVVTPAPPLLPASVAPAPLTLTYGDAWSAADLSLTAPVGVTASQLSGTPTYTVRDADGAAVTVGSRLPAGSYTLGVSGLTPPDTHDLTFGTATLTVAPRPVTVSARDTSRVYGASTSSSVLAYDVEGLAPGDDAADAIDGDPSVRLVTPADGHPPVGEHPIEVVGAVAAANHVLTTRPGTLTVTRRPLTVAVEDVATTHGQTPPAPAVTVVNLAPGDTLDAVTTGTLAFRYLDVDGDEVTPGDRLPAGTYRVRAAGLTARDYDLTFVDGDLQVGRRPVTITTQDATATYGDPRPTPSLTATGLLPDETVTDVVGADPEVLVRDADGADVSWLARPWVGTYEVSVVAPAGGDHDVTSVPGRLTVLPRPVTLAPRPATLVRGGAWSAADLELDTDLLDAGVAPGEGLRDVVPSATIEVLVDGQPVAPGSLLPVGTHTLRVAVPMTSVQYDVTFLTAPLTVEGGPITVAPADATVTYGEPWSQATFELAPPVGLVDGDHLVGTPTYTVLDADGEPVPDGVRLRAGTYRVLVGGLQAPTGQDLVTGEATLTVAPRTVTITARDADATYGSLPAGFAGMEVEGVADGDTPADALGGDPQVVVDGAPVDGHLGTGEHVLTVVGATATGDYHLEVRPGTLTVAPRRLTLTAADRTVVHGASATTGGIVVDGLASGDRLDDVTDGQLRVQVRDGDGGIRPDGERLPVGTYTLLPGGLTARDYVIDVEPGRLEVTPRPATARATVPDLVAGDVWDPAVCTVTLDGLLVGDVAADVLADAEVVCVLLDDDGNVVPSGTRLRAGGWRLQVAVVGPTGSYVVAGEDGEVAVAPRPVTVTAPSATIAHGDAWDRDTLGASQVEGLADGVDVTAVLTGLDDVVVLDDGEPVAFGADLARGTYRVTLPSLDAHADLDVRVVEGVLAVGPADPSYGPIAVDDRAGDRAGVPVTVDVLANDRAQRGVLVPATVRVLDQPQHATITSVDEVTGRVTYAPDADFVGQDRFTYQVCDDRERCATATVELSTPPVDLGVGIVLRQALVRGATATYDVEVVNNGPWFADGPIVLVLDVPAGLSDPVLTGDGWQVRPVVRPLLRVATGAGGGLQQLPAGSQLASSGTTLVAELPAGLELDVPSTLVLTATVTADAGVPLTVSTNVSGPTAELVYANNDASAMGTVAAAPPLPDPDPVVPDPVDPDPVDPDPVDPDPVVPDPVVPDPVDPDPVIPDPVDPDPVVPDPVVPDPVIPDPVVPDPVVPDPVVPDPVVPDPVDPDLTDPDATAPDSVAPTQPDPGAPTGRGDVPPGRGDVAGTGDRVGDRPVPTARRAALPRTGGAAGAAASGTLLLLLGGLAVAAARRRETTTG